MAWRGRLDHARSTGLTRPLKNQAISSCAEEIVLRMEPGYSIHLFTIFAVVIGRDDGRTSGQMCWLQGGPFYLIKEYR